MATTPSTMNRSSADRLRAVYLVGANEESEVVEVPKLGTRRRFGFVVTYRDNLHGMETMQWLASMFIENPGFQDTTLFAFWIGKPH